MEGGFLTESRRQYKHWGGINIGRINCKLLGRFGFIDGQNPLFAGGCSEGAAKATDTGESIVVISTSLSPSDTMHYAPRRKKDGKMPLPSSIR